MVLNGRKLNVIINMSLVEIMHPNKESVTIDTTMQRKERLDVCSIRATLSPFDHMFNHVSYYIVVFC